MPETHDIALARNPAASCFLERVRIPHASAFTAGGKLLRGQAHLVAGYCPLPATDEGHGGD